MTQSAVDMKIDDKKEQLTSKRQALKNARSVIVTGIDIPFGQCVGLMVKLALAAIPAGIIISFLYTFLGSILFGLLSGFGK